MISCIAPHGYELQTPQCTMLGSLTVMAMKHLGADTHHIDKKRNVSTMRTARVGDVVLVEQPADEKAPKAIYCLRVNVAKFDRPQQQDGLTFKRKYFLDSRRAVYSLQYLHNAEPPDFELLIFKDPRDWLDRVGFALLAGIRRHSRHLLDWGSMPKGIIKRLDALDKFDAATV